MFDVCLCLFVIYLFICFYLYSFNSLSLASLDCCSLHSLCSFRHANAGNVITRFARTLTRVWDLSLRSTLTRVWDLSIHSVHSVTLTRDNNFSISLRSFRHANAGICLLAIARTLHSVTRNFLLARLRSNARNHANAGMESLASLER